MHSPTPVKIRSRFNLKAKVDKIRLIVSDNGHGLPENYNHSRNDTFGMTLIQGMTEDLEGKFTMENHRGTKITVVFENLPVSKPPQSQSTAVV